MDELRPSNRRPSQNRLPTRKGSLLLFDYKHPSSSNLKDELDKGGSEKERGSGSGSDREGVRGMVREMSPKSPLAASSNILFNGERNARTFRAIQGIEFQGIPLSDEPIPPPNNNAPFAHVPVFLGPDGTLYDVNYIPVTEYTPSSSDPSDPLTKISFTPNSPVYSNFPEIESFENFFDYEQAVVDWRNSVLKNLGWLQLPTVLGRFYSRPKMISESRTRRDSTTSSDSASYADVEDRQASGSYVDSPPVDSRFGSMDFDFIPSPLPDTILDPMSASSSIIDSDMDTEFSIQRPYSDTEPEYHSFQVRPSNSERNLLNDSPNNSEREDMSKSPRANFRKSQSFTRSGSGALSREGSGSSSPGGPHRKLTHRLSDQDLRSQMLEGYEESRWVYSRDTWESTLVPPEPLPSYYATFEEYDAAMKRWAKECISKMTFIPPHALQLQELVKLNPAMELITDPRTQPVPDQPRKEGLELPLWKIRSGEIPYEQLHEPLITKRTVPAEPFSLTPISLPSSLPSTPRESLSSSTSSLTSSPSLPHVNSSNSAPGSHSLVHSASSPSLNSPSLSRLSAPTRRKLLECFETLGRNIDQEHLLRHFDILPAFTFNWKQSMQTKVANHVIPELPLKAARRTDIHAELDMSPLQREYPEPEPIFNYSKLLSPSRSPTERKAYVNQVRDTILQLDSAFRFDHLYSQFTNCSQKDINQLRSEFFSVLGQGHVTLEFIKKIVTSKMFVDKFKDFLGETVPNSYDDSTFLQMFMDLLQAEPLKSLLDLLLLHNDDIVKAKVATVITTILSVPRGHTWVALVIESYVDHDDLEALYKFAVAASFLQPKPYDVYPYRPTLHEPIIKKVFKNEGVQSIVTQVYVYYYLSVISKFSTHPDIVEWLDSKKKEVSNTLADSLQKDKSFLSSDLFKGIGHRSSTLSNHFLFIATQLLHCYDVSMQRVLRSPDAMLVTNITNLAYSKFIHTQFAARRLTDQLRDDPWRDFYLSEVDKSKTFFDDLKEVSERNPETPTLQSTLMLSLVDSTIANIPNNKEQLKTFAGAFLLSDDLFHKALNFIAKAKNLDASAEVVSLFLEKVSEALYTHNLAEASDKVKTNTKTKMDKAQEYVQISLADIQSITTIIHKYGADKSTFRTHMLNCLRNLLKHSRTFDLVKKETHIHLRLIGFCKDGKNMIFNKTAWKLFYQLLHYHKESIEQFEKSKILAQFLDILGTNSGNTIMLNSLRYTYKIFSILDREADRAKAGKSPSRGGDIKSLEKDLKFISRIFVQAHLFIKIHMIYKRLMGHQQGASFIRLAQLYHVIGKNPIYRKLCKDIQRNPEYKDGLFKICNMFYPPNTLNPVPNLALQS